MELKLTREEVEELILEGLAARHPTLPPIREITYRSYSGDMAGWWETVNVLLGWPQSDIEPVPVVSMTVEEALEQFNRAEEAQHASGTTPRP